MATASELARQRRSLQGRVGVVTASTNGIGFAMAQRLAVDGAHVVISSRNQKNVDEAPAKLKSEGLSVSGMVCHAGDKKDRTRLLEKTAAEFGGFDILISNAAVNPGSGCLMKCTEEVWDKIFDVNVKSSFFLSKEALLPMEKRGKASIMFVSSVAGYLQNSAVDFMGAYASSKTALLYSDSDSDLNSDSNSNFFYDYNSDSDSDSFYDYDCDYDSNSDCNSDFDSEHWNCPYGNVPNNHTINHAFHAIVYDY
ncbi:dehydrogenase/reductase SDR family member 4-like 2 isoform X2 [Daphnia pulicaria]|nr:dehydrogenase/reductase SDR family member 4-like 2 isoform X2 [Daphnia pulicaria]